MHVIHARNVNDALLKGFQYLVTDGIKSDSRNGEVTVSPVPVTTVYYKPWERVMLLPERDANPYFHLAEALWMLAGRNDIEFVSRFAGNMANYSDDGVTQWGAYGYRWRKHFGYDQVHQIIQQLKANKKDRRAVLAMHDGSKDLLYGAEGGLDQPCNLTIHFDITFGTLSMTVFCRSNDILWGAYGANAVHMSVLQEYVAACVGVPIGNYYQISDNFHMYTEKLYGAMYTRVAERVREAYRKGASDYIWTNPYSNEEGDEVPVVTHRSMFGDGYHPGFEDELGLMLSSGHQTIFDSDSVSNEFLLRTVNPMLMSHKAYKSGDFGSAIQMAECMEADDWKTACIEWLERRKQAQETKNAVSS